MVDGITHATGQGTTESQYKAVAHHVFNGVLPTPTGRTATYVIAASDAPAHVKAQADYVWDGTGDANAEVIQPAINALTVGRVNKETIKLVGSFSIATTIILPSFITLDLTQAKLTLTNLTVAQIISATTKTHIDIIGGIIDGNKAGQVTGGSFIYFNGCRYVKVEGCTIQNFYGTSLFFQNSTECVVTTNHFYANGTVGGDTALFFSTGHHNEVSLNSFYDNNMGVGAQGLEYSTISNNNFYNDTLDSINLTNTGSGNPHSVHCSIVGNTFQMFGNSAVWLNKMEYSVVSSNTIKGGNGHGIGIDYSSYCTISSNVIVGTSWSGIVMYKQVAGGSCSNNINGNEIYGCATAAAGGDDSGIDVINDTCDYNNIHNNTVRVGASSHQHSGIRVQSGAIGTIVTENDLRNSYIGGQPLLNAGTGTIVRDNQGYYGVGDSIIVRKLIDEAVNNSNVLQDDDELRFPVLANEVWQFEFRLYILQGASATPNYNEAITAPAGASGLWTDYTHPTTTGAAMNKSISFGYPRASTIGSGEGALVFARGIAIIGATAGDIQLKWAQTTATAVDTKVLAGSGVIATKIK